MINKPLLRKVMEHIQNHPEEHHQETWAQRDSCGTTYCFAGHTAIIEGWEPVWWNSSDLEDSTSLFRNPVTGKEADVEYIARQALGLTPLGAERLFYSCHTLDEVRATVEDILNRD